ncbi:MAG: selenide, water dikinase SelD [Gemmataceae bacterium]
MPATGIAQVLSSLPPQTDPNLLVGTNTHDDAGVYRITPEIGLVQTIDFFPPVVDDPFAYGQIAAANALSDVYAMGGQPLTALNLLGYPDDQLGPEWMREILGGGAERCREAKCTIVGGHSVRDTEIKFGMAVTGTVHPDKIIANSGARPGDVLVMTKPLGTGFVTTAAKKSVCPTSLYNAAVKSMSALNRVGRDAMIEVGVHAATDVTGFGLAGHALEMAEGANVTLKFDVASLPLFPGLAEIEWEKFKTRAVKSNREYVDPHSKIVGTPDPLKLTACFDPQTSGGLIIACPQERVPQLIDRLLHRGAILAVEVGMVERRGEKALVFA